MKRNGLQEISQQTLQVQCLRKFAKKWAVRVLHGVVFFCVCGRILQANYLVGPAHWMSFTTCSVPLLWCGPWTKNRSKLFCDSLAGGYNAQQMQIDVSDGKQVHMVLICANYTSDSNIFTRALRNAWICPGTDDRSTVWALYANSMQALNKDTI